jgi:hypothetical protein
LSEIRTILESIGFAVEESFNAKGKSGGQYKVDLFAYDHKHRTITIDIVSSQADVDDDKVNSMIVKSLDVSPTLAIFIAVPTISNTTKAIAEGHGISVISGTDFAEIIHKIHHVFKTRLKLVELV